jgi:hypothetical protein
MAAIVDGRSGSQSPAKKPVWVPQPILDDQSRVGLTFISAGYGVVLVAVFPMRALEYINLAGLSHLALAAFMLVISWMGYYTNRVMYPAWRVQFFNIPLWQYILSFGILLGYWELGITTKASAVHPAPTLLRETIIITLIFAAYLAWDILETVVQQSGKYLDELLRSGYRGPWPPLRRHYRTLHDGFKLIPALSRNSERRFAKDVRARGFVTLLFTCGYAVMWLYVYHANLKGTRTAVIVNCAYILSLFAYRYFQGIATHLWYKPLGDSGAGSPSSG